MTVKLPITSHKTHPYFRKRKGLLSMIDAMVSRNQMTVNKSDLRDWMHASNTKVARLIREGLLGGIFSADHHTVTLRPDWQTYIDEVVSGWPKPS